MIICLWRKLKAKRHPMIALTLVQPDAMLPTCQTWHNLILTKGFRKGPAPSCMPTWRWLSSLRLMSSVNLSYVYLMHIKKKDQGESNQRILREYLFSPGGHGKRVGFHYSGATRHKRAAGWQPPGSDLRGSAPPPGMQKSRRNLRTQTNKQLNKMTNPSSNVLLAIQQGASTH